MVGLGEPEFSSWDGPNRCEEVAVARVILKTSIQWLSPLQLQVACSSAWEGSSGDGRWFPAPGTVAGRPAPLWCRCGRVSACWGSVGGRLAVTGGVWAGALGSWRRRWGMRRRAAFWRPDGAKSVRRPSPAPPPSCWLPLCCRCIETALASTDSLLRYFAGFGGACRDAGGGAGADGRLDVAGNR